jgi:hypothetical protein
MSIEINEMQSPVFALLTLYTEKVVLGRNGESLQILELLLKTEHPRVLK